MIRNISNIASTLLTCTHLYLYSKHRRMTLASNLKPRDYQKTPRNPVQYRNIVITNVKKDNYLANLLRNFSVAQALPQANQKRKPRYFLSNHFQCQPHTFRLFIKLLFLSESAPDKHVYRIHFLT